MTLVISVAEQRVSLGFSAPPPILPAAQHPSLVTLMTCTSLMRRLVEEEDLIAMQQIWSKSYRPHMRPPQSVVLEIGDGEDGVW